MNKINEWIQASKNAIKKHCSPTEFKNLEKRLTSASPKEFAEGVSELVVSRYFSSDLFDDIEIPRGEKAKKDIDISLTHKGTRINIEVKCPDISHNATKEFTLHTPYTYPDFTMGKDIENSISEKLNKGVNFPKNKILNFQDFLTDCTEKFTQSADATDVNIALFSMRKIEWMDDYRIKLQEEEYFKNYPMIDVAVISNAAEIHKSDTEHLQLGFENCLNYIIFNTKSSKLRTL